jgi:endonuclease YncB( thermonuclease family)
MTFTDLKAYDGDTVKSNYAPVKGLKPLSFRLLGIDTPEMRGKCPAERAAAIKAKNYLNNEVLSKPISVEFVKWDKYGGRVLVIMRGPDGVDITKKLIDNNHGRPYNGGTKSSWCEENK